MPLQTLFSWIDITLTLLMATIALILNNMEPESRSCSQSDFTRDGEACLCQQHRALLVSSDGLGLSPVVGGQ